MKETMDAKQTAARQLLTIWYQNETLRVVVGREVRFVAEDIRRIARATDAPHRNPIDPRWASSFSGEGGESVETVGWSQALNLIDMGDLASNDIQQFGEWFLTGVIEQLCDERVLTGNESIDTSSVQESSFFRKALAALGGPEAKLGPRLH